MAHFRINALRREAKASSHEPVPQPTTTCLPPDRFGPMRLFRQVSRLTSWRARRTRLETQLFSRQQPAQVDGVATRFSHEAAAGTWCGIGYRAAGCLLVSPLAEIREIVRYPHPTRVPASKPWLMGVAHSHGLLMPIFDLASCFAKKATDVGSRARVLVVPTDEGHVGMLVEEVLGPKRFLAAEKSRAARCRAPWLQPFLRGAYFERGFGWNVVSLSTLVEHPALSDVAL